MRPLNKIGLLAASAAWLALAPSGPAAAPAPADAAAFLVVDCLLPGQVRKLGGAMTMLGARRAVRTTASDCEIRGGEYVAYDRANYATALAIWLPLAESGDVVAQANVGEIYEKGLGAAPDYAQAAAWYRKAAEKGSTRAQVNLGHLYERGLGVPRDPREALQWYRRASGETGAVALDPATPAPAGPSPEARELERLKRELEDTRQQLEKLKRELARERDAAANDQRRLEDERRKATQAGDSAKAQRLGAQLAERERELAKKRDEIAALEQSAERFRQQLARSEGESATLRRQLDEARQQLDRAQRELDGRHTALQRETGALASARGEVEALRQKVSAAADPAAMRRLEAQLKDREAQLKDREAELARRSADAARLEEDARRFREQLAGLEAAQKRAPPAASSAPQDAGVIMAGPVIQLIEPPVLAARGTQAVKVRSAAATRELVGRVTAPAGLMAFTINDREQSVDAKGLFRTQVQVTRSSTPVSLVAVDRQGLRASLEFLLVPENSLAIAEVSAAAPPPKSLSPVEVGNFHALIIGLEKYARLPRLGTAAADAHSVEEVLRTRYGFKTHLLLDATRYQILTKLNEMREKLTEKDNLLIYYAGHGELDEANQRGQWLPVDAEPNNTANWIPITAVTDILNVMSVRKVMVVADSCYSGALTRSSLTNVDTGKEVEEQINLLRKMAKDKTRVVLSSGGLKPVLDGGGGKHSVFAKHFISVLEENQEILVGRVLHLRLSAKVAYDADKYRFEQVPDYAPIRFAGHDGGDFLFVPATN